MSATEANDTSGRRPMQQVAIYKETHELLWRISRIDKRLLKDVFHNALQFYAEQNFPETVNNQETR